MAIFQSMTIRQIAEQANVSIATVSRALNSTGPVSDATMAKIQSAMEQLGYRPPVPADAPRKHVILVSFPNLTNPFNNNLIRGILAAASPRGYQVLFYTNENYNLPSGYRFLENSDICDGIIIVHNVPDPSILENITKNVPVVMCSEHISNAPIAYVAIDDYAAACTAVNYLINNGRKKIAMVNTLLSNNYAFHRERGYRACLEKAGIPADEAYILHLPDINFDIAASSIASLLDSPNRPDAFFCVSDVFAAAVIKAATERGIRIPEDLSVMGFDDIDLASMSTPAITTIRQPTYQLGYQSVVLLLSQIETSVISTNKLILNTDLIIRGST